VKVIVENVVTCFFWGHGVEHKKDKNEYKHISRKYKTRTRRLTLNNNY